MVRNSRLIRIHQKVVRNSIKNYLVTGLLAVSIDEDISHDSIKPRLYIRYATVFFAIANSLIQCFLNQVFGAFFVSCKSISKRAQEVRIY
jgi:hypothetical protein